VEALGEAFEIAKEKLKEKQRDKNPHADCGPGARRGVGNHLHSCKKFKLTSIDILNFGATCVPDLGQIQECILTPPPERGWDEPQPKQEETMRELKYLGDPALLMLLRLGFATAALRWRCQDPPQIQPAFSRALTFKLPLDEFAPDLVGLPNRMEVAF